MMKIPGVLVLSIALAVIGCQKTEETNPEPLMKKVSATGKGLPVAKAGKSDKAQVRASMGPASRGEMPDDAVHRGARGAATPPGHPETGHGSGMSPGETDGNPLPLKKTGLGGAGELADALKRIKGDEQKKLFEKGFRLTFCADRSKRDIREARKAFKAVLKAQPDSAEAYRGLAYVSLSDGFDIKGCEANYLKALEIRPDYGVVHYALAFLYLGSDRAKGAAHLKKAMELGVPDEQGLQKIYSDN